MAAGTGWQTRGEEALGRSIGMLAVVCCSPPPAGCWARASPVAAVARIRGFRRRAAQDVSSPSPYLVKVFQDSVIQLRGAAVEALRAGPATAGSPHCGKVPAPRLPAARPRAVW